MQAGCRIAPVLQSRDGRLSVCRRSARGGSAGRLGGSGLRVRRQLLAWFAGRSSCRGAVCGFAPASPLVHYAGSWLLLRVGSVQPLATPATSYDVAAASGGNSLFGILSL